MSKEKQPPPDDEDDDDATPINPHHVTSFDDEMGVSELRNANGELIDPKKFQVTTYIATGEEYKEPSDESEESEQ